LTRRWPTELVALLPKHEWPYVALLSLKDSITHKHVINFGAMDPWAEAACLALGSASVTTVDYNRLTFDHPQLSTLTVDALHDLLNNGSHPRWDVLLSFSSFDHDGLGRSVPTSPSG
jgi:hypothetical protein